MVRLFDKEKDYETVARWWFDHGQIPCPIDLLPNIGVIVDDIVAGFLYQTDSGIIHFESVISKKDSDKIKRREALIVLFDSCIRMSREMNYKQAVFYTLIPHFKELCVNKFGCKVFNGSVERFYKDLRSI